MEGIAVACQVGYQPIYLRVAIESLCQSSTQYLTVTGIVVGLKRDYNTSWRIPLLKQPHKIHKLPYDKNIDVTLYDWLNYEIATSTPRLWQFINPMTDSANKDQS